MFKFEWKTYLQEQNVASYDIFQFFTEKLINRLIKPNNSNYLWRLTNR